MKMIIAVVRPLVMDRLIAAFEDLEAFPGMTVADSEGFGQRPLIGPGDRIDPLRPNKRIEIICEDAACEAIVSTIQSTAHTGRRGDGFVAITAVDTFTLV